MSDGEVLNANSRRELVVNDSINDAGTDRENDDCKPMHLKKPEKVQRGHAQYYYGTEIALQVKLKFTLARLP